MTRIAALMNSADISATDESMDANRTASALLAFVSVYLRVCTIDECRYRLWGITVAPRMLTAMYSMSGCVRMSGRGMNPDTIPPHDGCAHQISTAKATAIATI